MQEEEVELVVNKRVNPNSMKVGQEQIHGLLFGDKLSWQSLIYDLINTEQLDPWDIDIGLLANKYLERVRLLEEANFFVSSKVLLATSLLLRIKSEILLNEFIPSLDEILFGKKEDKKYIQERIELDEDIPGLIPRTPLPRFRKVTLPELMAALGKAISTENRRIRKVVVAKQHEMELSSSIPKKRINILDSINSIYEKLLGIFKEREERLPFSHISGESVEDRVSNFVPLLHLETQQKVWLEQEAHLGEIWILLQNIYEKQNAEKLEKMRQEVDLFMAQAQKEMDEEEKSNKEILKSKEELDLEANQE